MIVTWRLLAFYLLISPQVPVVFELLFERHNAHYCLVQMKCYVFSKSNDGYIEQDGSLEPENQEAKADAVVCQAL